MSKILPEFPLTENKNVDYIMHRSQVSIISTINNLYSMHTLSMPRATRRNKLTLKVMPILATILMIIIFVNPTSAQTGAQVNRQNTTAVAQVSSAETNVYKKNIAMVLKQNSDASWGYNVIENGITVYAVSTKPGSETGYATREEAIAAAMMVNKAMQLQTKAIKTLTKNEMQDLLNKAEQARVSR